MATVEGPDGRCSSAARDAQAGGGHAAACLALQAAPAEERWWEAARGEQPAPEEADDRLHATLRRDGAHGSSTGAAAAGRPTKGVRGRAGWYTLLLLPSARLPGDGEALLVEAPWVGRYRHGWALYSQGLALDSAAEVASGGDGAGAALRGFAAAAGGGAGSGAGAAPLPLSAAGAAVLSFSLLNADPTRRHVTWDFGEFEARKVAPLVRTLAPLAAMSVESQVRPLLEVLTRKVCVCVFVCLCVCVCVCVCVCECATACCRRASHN